MDSIINQVPEEYRNIYKTHWSTIRHRVTTGVIKDVYHYPLVTASNSEILENLQTTLSNYGEMIKINVCFGFILRKRTTNELKFFHPSNNTMLFELPRMMKSAADCTSLIEDIEKEDAFEYARKQRPSTKWIVDRIICVRFDIFRLSLRR